MANLASKLSKLNPFAGSSNDQGDDSGEQIENESFGGGRTSRGFVLPKAELRVSNAIKSFLVHEGVLAARDAGAEDDSTPAALKRLLGESHVAIPRELLDRSHPLPEYFVSSSHNTYLMAEQLFGTSSASDMRRRSRQARAV